LHCKFFESFETVLLHSGKNMNNYSNCVDVDDDNEIVFAASEYCSHMQP
jgi:hypothetical protein